MAKKAALAPFERRRVSPTGPEDAAILLVGEAPGRDEHQRGYVFCGMAGAVLDAYLSKLGHPRHTVRVTNLVPFWPGPGNPDPSPEEIGLSWPALMAEIKEQQPERIVALGAIAAEHLLAGTDAEGRDLDSLNGRAVWQELPEAGWSGWVVPVYHPAAGLHDPHYSGLCFQGLGNALRWGADAEAEPRTDIEGQWATAADIQEAFWAAKACRGVVPTDTEGYQGDPWCLTFANTDGQSFMIAAEDRRLLAIFDVERRQFGVPLLLHNSLHDLGVLRAMGIDLAPGEYEDSIVLCFNTQQTSPGGQGLKPLSYRLRGVAMQEFEDVMRPVIQRIERDYLTGVLDRLAENEISVPGRAHPPAKRIASLLKPPKPGAKAPKPLKQRWADVCDDIPALGGLAREMVGHWPRLKRADVDLEALRPYACADAAATGGIWPHLKTRAAELCVERAYAADMAVIPVLERMRETGLLVDKDRLLALDMTLQRSHDELLARLRDFAGDADFNPRSVPQMSCLMYDRMGLSSPNAPGTDKKAMGMARPGPRARPDAVEFLGVARNYRVVEKVLNAYVTPLWEFIAADGRVHPNWNHTLVVSGRLSTRAPNILAFPARNMWGEMFRSCFQAPPGRVWISVDLSQIELRVLASESGDPAMCGIFLRGEDLHDATTRETFGIDKGHPDWELFRTFAKTINFGIAYGLTAYGLQQNLATMGVERAEAECQEIIDQWYAARPGVRPYFESLLAETRRTGYVRDLSGRIRWLPNVWVGINKIRSEAERAACNLAIQGGAQYAEKLGMSAYWAARDELASEFGYCEPLLQIHDDMDFEADEERAGELGHRIAAIMTEAAQPHFQVPITAGVKVGKSWGEMAKDDDTALWREAMEEAAA